jgi:hypothetical protein
LYDYEIATKMQIKKFKIEGPCKIFRNWLSIIVNDVAAETMLISNEEAKRGKLPAEDMHFLGSVCINRNGNTESKLENIYSIRT